MSKEIKELLELEAKIRYHDFLYHREDKPTISNSEYDNLVYRREELLERNPDFRPGLPPGFVLGVDSGLKTMVIKEPMLSITKKKTREDFEKWIATNIATYAVYEEKLDGVALRLIYRYGKLVGGCLRGSGVEGTDVTHRLHMVRNIPTYVEQFKDIEEHPVTGEAFCMLDELREYCLNWDLDPELTEPRTTCSGIIKRLYPAENDTLYLYFRAYGMGKATRELAGTYLELREVMTACGFDVPMVIDGSLLNELYGLTQRPNFGYPIDGIVVKDNDLSKWDEEKQTGYYNYTACYKFPTITLKTTVTGVSWGLTTKGYLVGTLLYAPVIYDGTTLCRAKFDYPDKYIESGIRIGSIIEVTKANEIIPNIRSLIEVGTGARIKFPEKCPCCDHMLIVESPVYRRCSNDNCPGLMVKQLCRLVDRKGLYIKGLGEKRITELVDNGYLSSPGDIFNITAEQYFKLDGFDKNACESIVKHVEQASKLSLANWLYAACIPEMGYTRAVEMAGKRGELFTDLFTFMSVMKDPVILDGLYGIEGLMMAQYVTENENEMMGFFIHHDFENTADLAPEGIPIGITGAWTYSRDELAAKLKEEGYDLSDKVSRLTYKVIAGEKPSPGKLGRAEKYGIEVIHISKLTTFDSIVKQLREAK